MDDTIGGLLTITSRVHFLGYAAVNISTVMVSTLLEHGAEIDRFIQIMKRHLMPFLSKEPQPMQR